MQDLKTIKLRQELNVWLYDTYKPDYFLTIQLSKHRKTFNREKADKEVWRMLKKFEKEVIGRNWHRKHLPFVLFAENHHGRSTWHYHCLFNSGKYTRDELLNAVYRTRLHLRLSKHTMCLKPEVCTPERLRDYCTKELKVRYIDEVETDRMIVSDVLFCIEDRYRFIPPVQK